MQQRTYCSSFANLGHGAQHRHHVQIFFAGQIRIEVGFLWDVAQVFPVRCKIGVDVSPAVQNMALRRLQQTNEHLDRGTFSRAVWAQVSQHLPGHQTKTNVANRWHRTVRLGESPRFKHGTSLHTPAGASYSFDPTGTAKVPPHHAGFYCRTSKIAAESREGVRVARSV